MSQKQIFDILSKTLKESDTLFNEKNISQDDERSYGFSLDLTLANSFLCCHETIWLERYSKKVRLKYYKRFVNNNFKLSETPEQFGRYINKQSPNISFSIAAKNNRFFPLLNI